MSNCINIIENQGSHCGEKREIYAINSVVLDLNWKYQYEFMIYIIPTSMNLKSFKKMTSLRNDNHIQHPDFGF